VESIEDYIPVQSRLPAEDLFALRVRGDSMEPEILAGDIVVVRRQPRAENGEIVVALVGSEATVKRLRLRRGRIELHAANSKYEPITAATGEVLLLGRVIELRRNLAAPRKPSASTDTTGSLSR
jgi:repressor LexA